MKTRLLAMAGAVALFSGCSKGDSSDNTPTPKISIGNAMAVEGNSGTTNFEFVVRLSNATNKVVSFNYTLTEQTAKAGDDYVAVSNQSFSLQPNEVEKKIIVTVVADDVRETDETFQLTADNFSNGSGPASATATIINDDTRILINNTGYNAPTSYPGYTLTWADEFNGSALDAASWSFQNGDGCPGLCGWGNNELEFYRSENLFFQDGKMIIEARKENVGGKAYTSSKIVSDGKRSFKYGRIDIRARLPKGKGLWPALWLLPQNNTFGGWPRSGELDLMEYLGHEPNKVYGTLHFGPGPGSAQINKSYVLPSGTFADEFHVFSIEWKQDQIRWLVDGNIYGTANKSDFGTNNYPFNEPFYFITNLAVGGNWPGSPDAGTPFPEWLMVDYVRVYQ